VQDANRESPQDDKSRSPPYDLGTERCESWAGGLATDCYIPEPIHLAQVTISPTDF